MTAHEQALTETISSSDEITPVHIYLVRVLSYLENMQHHFQLSLKVSSTQKTILDSAFGYAGCFTTFAKPFGDIETYDGTTRNLNIVGFNIIDCPDGITNPLILVVNNYTSEIVTGTRFYLFKVSGYKHV